MAETQDPKLFDKRTAARYREAGLLDEKSWERHLKALPDLADEALPVDTRMTSEPAGEADED
ncbi:MAG TPA: hypothetical protein VEJ89_17115 [Myxococcaceae bacterium]|nr:hypothetical protein [Myxococcaceae bacterium]